LSIPTDTDGNGKSDSIYENELSGGYENSDYFYTAVDGGMVFKSPVDGYKTSTNTSYVRVELREMLRGGNTSYATQGVNKNNWVFGSSPSLARENAGGVDGRLFATVAVNQVTTTGENYQIGRVIIGQIHANDDEPLRLYYRKLPDNSKGSVYFAHEKVSGEEAYYELVGSRSDNVANPSDGISLDEKFSYEIKVVGDFLRVSLLRPGLDPISTVVDMSDSGYNALDQYQYFKLGAYHVNNTADMNEFAQVTFYEISVDHN
jgi:poly(beta-D-mannuronate) lyase